MSGSPLPLEIVDLRTTLFTRRGEMKAVDGLSLSVGAGETVALVGESGCGKSLSALSVMRLLPDPPAALRHVRSLLAPGGRIYFTQTFEHHPSWLVERLKPLLHLLTTIDFGRVTYEEDFRRALADGGEAVEAFEVLNAGARRSGALAVSRPA